MKPWTTTEIVSLIVALVAIGTLSIAVGWWWILGWILWIAGVYFGGENPR